MLGLVSVAGGCRREPAPPPLRPVWVRRGALLPLHPAWSDVQGIDALRAHVARVAPPAAEPRRMARRVTPPRPLAPGPQARAADFLPGTELIQTALDRLELHRSTLRARSEQRVAELRRTAEADAAVAVEVRRKELATRAAEKEAALCDEVGLARRELEMRVIVLESRVRAMPGPARVAAEAELVDVRARMQALDASLAERLADVRVNLDRDLDQYRQALAARVDAEMADETARDEDQAEATLTAYRQQLRDELAALAPAEGARLPGARSVPAVSLPAPGQGAEGVAPAPASIAGREASAAALLGHRALLAAAIRRDVDAQLAKVAAQKGWRLASAPAAGAADVTAEAGIELRRRYAREFTLPQSR